MNSPEADDSLQFDRAEYSEPQAASVACKACGNAIVDHYYDVNGQTVCENCCRQVAQQPAGSARLRTFVRAALRGSLAAFAGFMLYYVVLKVTGLQIGLISIVVGFLVGNAVYQGSGRRGGWVYQLLAIFLTYTAISASYAMVVLPQIMVEDPNKAIDKPLPAAKKQPAAEQAAPIDPRQMSTPMLILALVMSLAILYVFPIYAGFSSPIGLLIIGFALWEAWKLNRRVAFVIQGPFSLAALPATTHAIEPSAPNEAEADD